MRVVYAINYYKPAYVYGGPSVSVPAFCEALADAGADVSVITTNANGKAPLPLPEQTPVVVNGVRVHTWPIGVPSLGTYFFSPAMVRGSKALLRDVDLAILDLLWTHPFVPMARHCVKHRIPYVVPTRGGMMPWTLHRKRIVKRLFLAGGGMAALARAAALQCSTQDERDALDASGFDGASIVVPNPVPAISRLEPDAAARFWSACEVPSGAFKVLLLGRLQAVKRPNLAIEALSLMQHADVHLVFAGPDEDGMTTRLRTLAAARGCRQRVHFLGLLDRRGVTDALGAADALLSVSQSESFGMTLAEAMAAGIPAICVPTVPLGREAADSGAALLVDASPAGIASGLDWLSADGALRRRMGEAGRAFAARRLSAPTVASLALDQYRRLASSIRTAAPPAESPGSRSTG